MRRNKGFTLVELLVVITIIAMLAALILPAVQSAREAGRRTQCINNMRNMALAVTQYDSAKQKFPPSYSVYRKSPVVTEPTYLGWVVKILPQLERNDLFERFNQGMTVAAPTTESLDYEPLKVDFLFCPSSGIATAAPISYAVNAGREDATANNTIVDWQENGVFFSEFTVGTGQTPVAPITTSYIGRNDGNSNTIMLSENINSQQQWNKQEKCSEYREGQNGIVWFPYETSVGLNQKVDEFPGFADATAIQYARPSSVHGGYNVAFCDGSVKLISTETEYRIYALLTTTNGMKSKKPGTKVGDPIVLTKNENPTNYGEWIKKPLGADDIK